jgi:ABC-type glycerol-3-phosphate transport system permease component
MRRAIIYTLLAVFGVIVVFPFVWMLLLSFKSMVEINRANTFLPETWTIRNYITVFTRVPILSWFRNSVVVTVSATTIILLTSSLIGFVFAKFDFKLKDMFFWFILATMMVPPQTTMIPSFILISNIGLYDKLAALVVPTMIGGFGIFLCRQFIADIPDSLCEAALIDGAGPFYIYFRIIVPLIRPAIGALTIFMFLQYWNDYMNPLLYINKPENMTMSLAISFFSSQRSTDIGAIMAAATLVMLPVTIVFLAFQKQFIKSVAIAGMK